MNIQRYDDRAAVSNRAMGHPHANTNTSALPVHPVSYSLPPNPRDLRLEWGLSPVFGSGRIWSHLVASDRTQPHLSAFAFDRQTRLSDLIVIRMDLKIWRVTLLFPECYVLNI